MRQDEGFVLVIVLWILAALTVITIGFAQRSSLEMRASAYAADHAQAMMMARGAAHRGMVELQNKWIKDMAAQTESMTYLGQPWAQPTDLIREGGYFTLDASEFQDDKVEFRIEDAESRINLNTAPEDLLESIEALGRRGARQIVRRREEEAHEGEGPTNFQAIEEVRYLEGVDDEDWFGDEDHAGLRELLTTHGDGKININTASEAVLKCIPEVGDDGAGQIIAFRAGADGKVGTPDDKGFKTVQEAADKAGIRGDATASMQQYCKVTSNIFMIHGLATRRGGKVMASVTAVAIANQSTARILSWREEPLGS